MKCLQHLGGGGAFPSAEQNLVAAGFQTDIQRMQPLIPKGAQLRKGFGQHVCRPGVHVDVLYPGHMGVDNFKNLSQAGGAEDKNIASGEKDGVPNPVFLHGGQTCRVLGQLLQGDHSEGLVDFRAEGTLGPAAAHCYLQQDAVGLRWGTIDQVIGVQGVHISTSCAKYTNEHNAFGL